MAGRNHHSSQAHQQRSFNIITNQGTSELQENYKAQSQGSSSRHSSSNPAYVDNRAAGSSSHTTSSTGYAHGDSYTGSSSFTSGSHGGHSYGGYDQTRVQAQDQRFRNAQASKQMVYGVYGNAVAMMEELESRERGGGSVDRSGIYMPSQSGHDKDTVERKIDTQILLLQSQLQSCDRDILDDVKNDLQKRTLDWMSQREAKKLKHGKTDKYAGKLYEVLAKGRTDHPADFYKSPSIGERDMKNAMGNIMKGQHAQRQLDQDFKHDPHKRAVAPNVRGGAGRELGAERMVKVREDLRPDVDRHRSGYGLK